MYISWPMLPSLRLILTAKARSPQSMSFVAHGEESNDRHEEERTGTDELEVQRYSERYEKDRREPNELCHGENEGYFRVAGG